MSNIVLSDKHGDVQQFLADASLRTWNSVLDGSLQQIYNKALNFSYSKMKSLVNIHELLEAQLRWGPRQPLRRVRVENTFKRFLNTTNFNNSADKGTRPQGFFSTISNTSDFCHQAAF